MALTYRTSAYGGANTPLTNAQIDENFSWLDLNKSLTKIKGGAAGTLVSGDVTFLAGTNVGITQSGNSITITANDTSIAWTELTGVPSTFAPSAHVHAATDITSGTLDSARLPAFTGDATSAVGTSALTLATVNPNTGSFGGTTSIPVITVNAKGLITGVTTATVSSLPTQTGNTGKYLTTDGTTASWATVNAGGATLSDDTTTDASYYPTMSTSISGTFIDAKVSSTNLYFNPFDGTLNSISFNSLSDVRFKTDLVQITQALDKLQQLTGYTFSMIESNTRSSGLIAQDLQKVLPESVGGTKDKLTVNYGAVMGLLVEAIKELNDKVDNIQKQINNK